MLLQELKITDFRLLQMLTAVSLVLCVEVGEAVNVLEIQVRVCKVSEFLYVCSRILFWKTVGIYLYLVWANGDNGSEKCTKNPTGN